MTPDARISDWPRPRRSRAWTGSRRGRRSSPSFEAAGPAGEDRAAPPRGRATVTAATPSWSPGCPISGSCGWRRWPRPRWPPSRDGRSRSSPSAGATTTPSGWKASATGASPGSSGGATASRCGTVRRRACGLTSVSREDLEACPGCGGAGAAGRGRARHLVLLLAGALLQPRLAGRAPPTWPGFYPGHTLVTAPEILFFWVARMIMAGLRLHGRGALTRRSTSTAPSGTPSTARCPSPSATASTRSRWWSGYGADALRYTVVAGMAVGTDLNTTLALKRRYQLAGQRVDLIRVQRSK